ncbi:MAG: GNAT family N-acetyltransferase [Candidatus Methanoplasma sp.]|jgi:aminoglycoside 6'-N-acetyltransferase I|nr:GNAT family N-acetyltransferase [Candidatus Methanoplasma sp.]
MEIRQMKLKDAEKVRELEISCIREYFAETIENKWEELPKEWRDNLGASSKNHFASYLEGGLSFVAEEDGEIYGFIFAKMLEHVFDLNKLVWIENMGVHPYVRRNAVGYKLLREVLRKGQTMGADAAHSMVQPGNAPSIMLHKKIGFFMDRREVALIDLKDQNLKL